MLDAPEDFHQTIVSKDSSSEDEDEILLAAKKLAEDGVEVVQASFDNEASLVKAFEVCRQFLSSLLLG